MQSAKTLLCRHTRRKYRLKFIVLNSLMSEVPIKGNYKKILIYFQIKRGRIPLSRSAGKNRRKQYLQFFCEDYKKRSWATI
jgi:hypothetical protein